MALVPYAADGKMDHSLDYACPDVWPSLAAMAVVTTAALYLSVYLLPLCNPTEVARQAGPCALINNNCAGSASCSESASSPAKTMLESPEP